MTDLIAEAITAHWGERCVNFDPDCFCCRAWKAYDERNTVSFLDGILADPEAMERMKKHMDLHWEGHESEAANAIEALKQEAQA